MRLKPKQSYIRSLSLIICLSITISSLGPAILCIGEKGHIAIEAIRSRCCQSFAAGANQSASIRADQHSLLSDDDDCGSCVDIPLSAGFSVTPDNIKKVSSTLLPLTMTCPWAIKCSDPSEFQSASEFFIRTHYFTPLRSVILLI